MSLLSWWKPKCSVGFREKAWIETRMRWLGEQFGIERLTRCEVVLPTDDFFPDAYDATPDAAERLLDRVCDRMQVNRSEIDLQIHPEDDLPGAVGLYEPGVVHLVDTQLADPMALVATLAHELAHHILIGRGLLEGEPDLEWTTDLTTVYFGFGIFGANATISESHGNAGQMSWWSVKKQGYLPSRMTAYAMALRAWLSGDTQPNWVGHLRLDAASAFDEGMRYLERTKDSLLRPDNIRQPDATSIDGLVHQLEHGTPSARVAALWELARRGPEAGKAVPAIVREFSHAKTGIRAEAARTLAELGASADEAIPALVHALDDWEVEVRSTAAFALGKLRLQPQATIEPLTERLDDPSTLATVAWALAQFGDEARPALPRLLNNLRGELGRCSGAIDYLAYAVRAIAADPEVEMQQLVASCDADLQQQADHLLPEGGDIPFPRGGAGWWSWADGLP
jgi:hypothetical protein